MNIRDLKKENSDKKIQALRTQLKDTPEIDALGDLTIFLSGSYARKEASEHSDIDLFFMFNGQLEKLDGPNIKRLRLFSKIVEISDRMGFPKFSNDGEYLKILEKPRILSDLGGPNDDYQNHFTARLLMILESEWVYGENTYQTILKDILNAYFKDYPDHPKDFQPTFLVNDIIRFWKTLCLNYENKRNQPEDDSVRIIAQKIKNLKLKFSRMLTCYGSICYIVSQNGNIGSDDIIRMSSLSPLERLQKAAEPFRELDRSVEKAIENYEWFLNLTNVSEAELKKQFAHKPTRTEAFEKASSFGEEVFIITRTIAEKNDYLRFLLV